MYLSKTFMSSSKNNLWLKKFTEGNFSNILNDDYKEFHNAMQGKKMIKHFIKHITEYDMPLKNMF